MSLSVDLSPEEIEKYKKLREANDGKLPPGIKDLKSEVEACMKCPLLVESRKLYSYKLPTFGYGDFTSKIVIVGLAPGKFGCGATGIPFARDRSGLLYAKALAAVNLTMETVWTTNVVKCTPRDNREPSDFEVSSCSSFLERELKIIKPIAVIAVGRVAEKTVKTLFAGRFIIRNIYHPAYYLRINSPDKFIDEFKKTYTELAKLIERVELSRAPPNLDSFGFQL
jgi:DNA polymerase